MVWFYWHRSSKLKAFLSFLFTSRNPVIAGLVGRPSGIAVMQISTVSRDPVQNRFCSQNSWLQSSYWPSHRWANIRKQVERPVLRMATPVYTALSRLEGELWGWSSGPACTRPGLHLLCDAWHWYIKMRRKNQSLCHTELSLCVWIRHWGFASGKETWQTMLIHGLSLP